MAILSQSEDAVREKAYQLWQARGMGHGRDKEDWLLAAEMLSQGEPNRAVSAGTDRSSAIQLVTDGMLGIATLTLDAATHAFHGLFASAGEKGSANRAAGSAEHSPERSADEASEPAERKLQP